MIPGILDKLTDEELKREAKNELKSDIVSAIIKSSKNLASKVENQDELIRTLEGFRLKMILRQLQISSFNGKMNALNEINKVISSVSYYPNRHHGIEEEEYLTPERMAVSIRRILGKGVVKLLSDTCKYHVDLFVFTYIYCLMLNYCIVNNIIVKFSINKLSFS